MSSPSVEKQALSDYSEIFQERYDAISNEQEILQEFFQKVNTWYYKVAEVKKKEEKEEDDDEDEILKNQRIYQYFEETQTEFLKFQTELSAITKAVYLVVKDVSTISGSDTEAYQKSDYIRKEGDPEQGQRQVINVNTAKPSIFHKMLGKKQETNIPKSLEDAWIRSEDWKDEIRNIPQIWRKLVVYHHYGVQWQNEFDGYGMINYRNNEITFLNTRIEPLISNIVSRALEIRGETEGDRDERLYTSTLQMEKELETARLMTGQGGEENPQKTS